MGAKIDNFDITWVELRPSNVCKGVGVFAIKNIPQDTIIFEYAPEDVFYSWEEITDPAVAKLVAKLCHITPQGFYIAGHPSTLGMAYYVNHSENPNVYYDTTIDNYISLVDIKVDQELVCIYDKEEQDWLI